MAERTCSIEACDKPDFRRTWCSMHYSRWQRHGSALWSPPTSEERFLRWVDQNGPIAKNRPDLGRCWIWNGARNKKGYGRVNVNQTMHNAHRWAYEHWVGPVPDGLLMDHFACDRHECVNPRHVRPVTPRENVLRSDTNIVAINRAKTHCVHGHEFTEANTYLVAKGRLCRECRREADRRYWAKDGGGAHARALRRDRRTRTGST